jgi:3-hydroxyisobutyrate dehydrogenase-like beta-hydroxyacid dehydrogenase
MVEGEVLVVVRTGVQFEAAVLGDDGIVTADTPVLVVVMATIGPSVVRDVAARLPGTVRLLDAPVSGGVARAVDGDLMIMVSGSDATRRDASPLLEALGRPIVVGAEPGAAQAVKLVNQVVLGTTMTAVAEGVRLARMLGVTEAVTLDVLRRGTARSWVADEWERVGRYWDPNRDAGSLDLIPKDMELALDELRGAGEAPDGRLLTRVALEQLITARAAASRAGADER